jgi:hypothetical protein
VKGIAGIFGAGLLLSSCVGPLPFLRPRLPGLDAPVVREAVVEAPAEHVWMKLTRYVTRQRYRTYVVSEQSRLISFGLISAPLTEYMLSQDAAAVVNSLRRVFETHGYESEVYVTILITSVDMTKTKISVWSLIRLLGQYKGEVANLGLQWGGRIEREILEAAAES